MWWRRLMDRMVRRTFKPGVIEWAAAGVTEIVVEDTLTVYTPLHIPGVDGACVDLGYSVDGRLVAIKVWSLVGRRPAKA